MDEKTVGVLNKLNIELTNAECLREGLHIAARVHEGEKSHADSRAFGELSFLVACLLFDDAERKKSARAELKRLTAAGRRALVKAGRIEKPRATVTEGAQP